MISPDFIEFLNFGIVRRILEYGRQPGDILDHVGSILVEYQPEPTHMDLIRNIVLDFGTILPLFNSFNMYICSIQTVYMLDRYAL